MNKKSRLLPSILTGLLILLQSHSILGQQHSTPFTDDTFISDWLICGPFPSNVEENINTDFLNAEGGETGIYPEAGLSHPTSSIPGGSVQWQYAKTEDSGRLNFRSLLSPNQKNVVYAAALIECEEAQPVIFKFGSNDRLKVWVNGKLIHFYSQIRAGEPDTDQIPVGLKKGKNLVLAKVDNDGGLSLIHI